MSNPNIAKEASKGGKARWKGVPKKVHSEICRKGGIISAALRRRKKEAKLLDEELPKG